MIVTYLTSVKEGKPTRLAGALYWAKALENV